MGSLADRRRRRLFAAPTLGSAASPLGRRIATPGALEALSKARHNPKEFLDRHARGDWGEVCGEDAKANHNAMLDGERLLSVYRTALGVRLWVITEADRSVTTVLLPEEY